MRFPIFILYDQTRLVGFVEILDDGPGSDIYRELMLAGDGILAPAIGDGKVVSYGAFPFSNHISNKLPTGGIDGKPTDNDAKEPSGRSERAAGDTT